MSDRFDEMNLDELWDEYFDTIGGYNPSMRGPWKDEKGTEECLREALRTGNPIKQLPFPEEPPKNSYEFKKASGDEAGQLMYEYWEKFHEKYPWTPAKTEAIAIAEIKASIEKGEPIREEHPTGVCWD